MLAKSVLLATLGYFMQSTMFPVDIYEKIEQIVGYEILDYIVACHSPNDVPGNDTCLWRQNVNGRFLVKVAYKCIFQFDVPHVDTGWKEIWNNALSPRIKHFLWVVELEAPKLCRLDGVHPVIDGSKSTRMERLVEMAISQQLRVCYGTHRGIGLKGFKDLLEGLGCEFR
ncbi:hypothetical protein PVK06_026052 [Gossypium arboreum]|uniref:Uncharacterized protein n=1 Tax=Gossypium arboreum TaxID=29729 RepID=A0ABR0NWL1_GOSAR|nr:hypothetical protein PVK06_026052 [Gossypium arboreum]